MHMLMSERYDVSVFNRVEKYFCRFYSPHSAAATVSLDAVDVILNPALEAQFAVANAIYEKQFSGLSEMKVWVNFVNDKLLIAIFSKMARPSNSKNSLTTY